MEFMEPLRVSQNQLARDIDVPVSRVAGIIKGTRAITADTAMRFGQYFGTSPDMWLRLQAQYDLRLAQRTTWTKNRRSSAVCGCMRTGQKLQHRVGEDVVSMGSAIFK